jgi:hypothetical protein
VQDINEQFVTRNSTKGRAKSSFKSTALEPHTPPGYQRKKFSTSHTTYSERERSQLNPAIAVCGKAAYELI